MTKKDTELVASALKASRPRREGTLDGVNADWQWRNTVGTFVNVLAASNQRFNEKTFRTAAGFWDDRSPATKAI